MKANIYRNIKVNARTAVAALLLCSGMVACNDVMEDSLKYDYPATDTGNLRSGHVLLAVRVMLECGRILSPVVIRL